MLKSISIPVFLLFSISAFSQTENSQKILMEQEIDQLIITINNIPDINRKFKLNDSIYSLLDTLILKKSLFHDRLDSIKNLRMVYSPDSCFRILTWYFLPSPDTYFYNGIFQYNNSTMNGSKSNLFHLKDYSDQMKNPDLFIGTDTSWYGSIYYDIILKEFNGIKYYVLLGYDYNSLISRKKIIDVLTIQNGNIYFGAHIFTWPDRILSRVIFEFSCSAGMTLKYNSKSDEIIFDHLVPSKPLFEGQYQFYGPDFSVDALKFKDGKWNYIPNIDAKNPKEEKKKNK